MAQQVNRKVDLSRLRLVRTPVELLGRPAPRTPLVVVLVATFAATKLALHFLATAVTPYGIHRDEFLYLAMGRHLRLWGMDFPPLIALLAESARGIFGDTLFAVRFFPALAGAALVVLAALIARELGGGRFAQATAMLAVLLGPLFLRASALFQPVVLDQLWWTLGLYALARIGKASRPGEGRAWWVLLGVAGGLGLLTKFSILFFGVGVLAALFLSPLRPALRTPWPYVAVGIALLLGSPSIVGQVRLGFPVVGQMHDLRSAQLQRVGALDFLGGQLLMGPAVLLALAGVAYLLQADRAWPYRAVGWSCLVSFLVLLALQGKAYYVGPVYPALFAAGATALEALPGVAGSVLRPLSAVLVAAFGVLVLPFGLPVVPPPQMARYAAALGITSAVTTNRGEVLPLPQDYADMLGWEEQVAAVARVYHALPPEQRARAVVLASNYGEAGAIDFYGPRHGLPQAVCACGSYWFFGPGTEPGEVAVSLGSPAEDLVPFYRSVHLAATVDPEWVVPEERNNPVVVAEGPYRTLQQVWPSLAGRN